MQASPVSFAIGDAFARTLARHQVESDQGHQVISAYSAGSRREQNTDATSDEAAMELFI